MHIEEGEIIVKVTHHHPFPFFLRGLRIGVVSLPFYLVASFFQGTLTFEQMLVVYGIITGLFGVIIGYDLLVFWLDKLVITNRRLVHVDWKSLFFREETEAEFSDIQDIETEEKGILSNFKIFDYGLIRIQTASTKISIIFNDANDPEGIKHFIYRLQAKPSRIRSDLYESATVYDRERTTEDHAISVGRQKER